MQYSQTQLEAEISQLCRDEHVIMLDLSISKHNGRQQLRVIGDRRDGGLTINDCVHLARQIQHLIDERKLMDDEYRLEVSSPGLDYPLRADWQFTKNLGRLLKLNVHGERGPREISGRLMTVDASGITLAADKTEWKAEFSEIISAKVLPEFHSPRTEARQ